MRAFQFGNVSAIQMKPAASRHGLAPTLLLAVLLLSGCVAEIFTPEAAPTFEVRTARAPLYKFGPRQVAPPDAWLREGTQVLMLRREFGYSFVQLDDTRTGYIANLDLKESERVSVPTGSVVEALPISTPEPTRPTPNLPIVDDVPLPEPDLDGQLDDPPVL